MEGKEGKESDLAAEKGQDKQCWHLNTCAQTHLHMQPVHRGAQGNQGSAGEECCVEEGAASGKSRAVGVHLALAGAEAALAAFDQAAAICNRPQRASARMTKEFGDH